MGVGGEEEIGESMEIGRLAYLASAAVNNKETLSQSGRLVLTWRLTSDLHIGAVAVRACTHIYTRSHKLAPTSKISKMPPFFHSLRKQ